MSQNPNTSIAVVGIDIGKNSFHIVGLDQRGAIVLRQKWSRGQMEARLANMPPCLIGMEACVGAHHLSRKLRALGHDGNRHRKTANSYSPVRQPGARSRRGRSKLPVGPPASEFCNPRLTIRSLEEAIRHSSMN